MRLEPTDMLGNATTAPPTVPSERCNASYEDSTAILVTVYSAVCALGLPANCLTAWLALLQVRRGHVLAVYLLCLALCELLYIGTLPLWIVYVRNQHQWALGPTACQATAYIFFCNVYVSILFLCCISCDRYVAVVHALESRGHRRQRTAIFVSAAVFVLVGLVHYPVFRMDQHGTCFETVSIDRTIARYHYARFAVGFAAPLSVITFTNLRIFRSVQRSVGLTAAQKAKARHLVIAVVVIFLVCFAPYHVVLLIKAITFSYFRAAMCPVQAGLSEASAVFLSLSTVSGVADPIIYMLATDHSRQEVSRIHQGWKKWSLKTDVTKLTCSKDSEEVWSPSCALPRPVHPPGPQLDTGGSLCTLERLAETPRAGRDTLLTLLFSEGGGARRGAAWHPPSPAAPVPTGRTYDRALVP
ncbi:probable G-protein coupled receptor 132 [Tupaia chinensis]|uniref:probable G-protein coupled receptor 132 n=1 Tax=Tupaia chinensis TaxID=246437 RepID=UPI000FFB8D2F|nr:probable G-protein coupled receptor 132 [Tupaia chinensis]